MAAEHSPGQRADDGALPRQVGQGGDVGVRLLGRVTLDRVVDRSGLRERCDEPRHEQAARAGHHRTADGGGEVDHACPAARVRVRAVSTDSAAARIATSGAGEPVKISSCNAAWWASRSSPETSTRSPTEAASGVGHGS